MRLNGTTYNIPELSFNPRICKRCDLAIGVSTRFLDVSIHASVKDATKVCQNSHLLFYAQSPDFHKLGLCYNLKILYL